MLARSPRSRVTPRKAKKCSTPTSQATHPIDLAGAGEGDRVTRRAELNAGLPGRRCPTDVRALAARWPASARQTLRGRLPIRPPLWPAARASPRLLRGRQSAPVGPWLAASKRSSGLAWTSSSMSATSGRRLSPLERANRTGTSLSASAGAAFRTWGSGG